MRTGLAIFALLGSVGAALASDALTRDQSSRLQAALDAQGCSGGVIRVSSGGYDIAGAKCGDQRLYDFTFDHEFKLLKKDARS